MKILIITLLLLIFVSCDEDKTVRPPLKKPVLFTDLLSEPTYIRYIEIEPSKQDKKVKVKRPHKRK